MLRKPLRAALIAVAALLPALAVGPVLVSTAPPAAAATTPVRVMPLGDSITGSPGCWRAVLWNRLQSTGYPDVDFVGTLGPQGCGVPYDGDNEGHGGYLVTNVANQNLLPGWLAATHPDVVLMHFGTNDVWSNIAPATILAAYSKLVDQMRASNPATTVLVAKIIPMNPSSCPECGQRVVALNSAIDGWAAGKTTTASPVVVVDQWTGFDTATDTYDGVHPNAAGDQKMSDRWYPALTAALRRATPTPTTSPTGGPSPTDSPTPTPTPTGTPGGCAATYRTAGQWPGGFQGEVTVANTGTAPTSGWTVRFTLPDGQRITQAWGAELTQDGTSVTARDAGWNGVLAPAAQTSWGFLASGTPIMVPLTCTAG
ncbi:MULTISPECIES: cellulose binding domain-containing protein [Micromonospora]|uniref:Cellulose-binding protein n=1 Tax=Micromonospora solifontis TaxID=2487138 RepID=A0ABX9WJE6_9ACTN|nr:MULTISPECIES: cellulose binding domain-containing protein [Micromonospora]NES14054.1 cellulose-binding protein [Micromonospora sp. PPF5-17B]NES35684.1 cellulose-binding protein [Micromonospora solifontis]NES56069.1 cellulose-binding protein [Micromonospora sp. PPF5-6]RNM00365.1 cellulose-binding protein [Micromonospora solifontis]